MRFGIILSIDCPGSRGIRQFLPPRRLLRRKLRLTEGDEQYDYGYLEGEWKKGKHRKLVGELSRKEFDEVVEELSLHATDVETMGSLGVPWSPSGFGIAPAVSFDSDAREAIINAYVTPLPEVKGPWPEHAWERVRRATINCYSRDGQYRARLRAHARMKEAQRCAAVSM